jgi:hypothetical protein
MHSITTKLQNCFLLADDSGILGTQDDGKCQATALFDKDSVFTAS